MDSSIFKFLLKKGLVFPRDEKELDFVKENVLKSKEEEKEAPPSFEETWNFIKEKSKDATAEDQDIERKMINASGMAQAARHGSKISAEIRKRMNKDKEEARNKLDDNQSEEGKRDS